MLTAYVLSGIKRSKALSSILSAAQVLLSTKPTNIYTTARLSTRPCLWALLIFPLSNMKNPQKDLAPSPAGQQSHQRVQEQASGRLHSPCHLLRLTVPQELLHLLAAALLVLGVLRKVVQDPGEAAGRGVMA